MTTPPRTVEVVISTSGWSKPANRIRLPTITIVQTTAKYRRHMMISTFCVFPVANRHPFSAIFDRDLTDPTCAIATARCSATWSCSTWAPGRPQGRSKQQPRAAPAECDEPPPHRHLGVTADTHLSDTQLDGRGLGEFRQHW
jgi:hypothetical protein